MYIPSPLTLNNRQLYAFLISYCLQLLMTNKVEIVRLEDRLLTYSIFQYSENIHYLVFSLLTIVV